MQIKFKRFKMRVNKCAVVSKWECLTHSLINNTQILVRHSVGIKLHQLHSPSGRECFIDFQLRY